jgi:hypothetical protein
LFNTGKILETLTVRTIRKYIQGRNLLHSSQFGFEADQSKTLQHIRLNFNNNMSMAAVFLDIAKDFDKTRTLGYVINCQN